MAAIPATSPDELLSLDNKEDLIKTRNMLNMEAEAKRQEAKENMLRNMQQKREEMQALLAEKDSQVEGNKKALEDAASKGREEKKEKSSMRRRSIVLFQETADAALEQEQLRHTMERMKKEADISCSTIAESEAESAERKRKIEEKADKASAAYAANLKIKSEKEAQTAAGILSKDQKTEAFCKERDEGNMKKKEEKQALSRVKRMSVLLIQEAAFTIIEQKRLEVELERLRKDDGTAVQLGVSEEEHARRLALSEDRAQRIQAVLKSKEEENARHRAETEKNIEDKAEKARVVLEEKAQATKERAMANRESYTMKRRSVVATQNEEFSGMISKQDQIEQEKIDYEHNKDQIKFEDSEANAMRKAKFLRGLAEDRKPLNTSKTMPVEKETGVEKFRREEYELMVKKSDEYVIDDNARLKETRKKEASENRRKSIVLEKKMDRAQKAVEQSNNDQEARQEVLRKKQEEKDLRTALALDTRKQEHLAQVVAKREEYDRKCSRASVSELPKNGSTPQKVRTIVVQKSSPSKMQQLAVTAPVTPMRRGSLRPQATEESSPTDSGGLAFLI